MVVVLATHKARVVCTLEARASWLRAAELKQAGIVVELATLGQTAATNTRVGLDSLNEACLLGEEEGAGVLWEGRELGAIAKGLAHKALVGAASAVITKPLLGGIKCE